MFVRNCVSSVDSEVDLMGIPRSSSTVVSRVEEMPRDGCLMCWTFGGPCGSEQARNCWDRRRDDVMVKRWKFWPASGLPRWQDGRTLEAAQRCCRDCTEASWRRL